jgi:hypothetical protein
VFDPLNKNGKTIVERRLSANDGNRLPIEFLPILEEIVTMPLGKALTLVVDRAENTRIVASVTDPNKSCFGH